MGFALAEVEQMFYNYSVARDARWQRPAAQRHTADMSLRCWFMVPCRFLLNFKI
jgi:hypothetical protein